jgi:hypothetical protein
MEIVSWICGGLIVLAMLLVYANIVLRESNDRQLERLEKEYKTLNALNSLKDQNQGKI